MSDAPLRSLRLRLTDDIRRWGSVGQERGLGANVSRGGFRLNRDRSCEPAFRASRRCFIAVERHVCSTAEHNQLCVKANNSKKNTAKIKSSCDICKMKGREYSIRPRTSRTCHCSDTWKGYAGAECEPSVSAGSSSLSRMQTAPSPDCADERTKQPPISTNRQQHGQEPGTDPLQRINVSLEKMGGDFVTSRKKRASRIRRHDRVGRTLRELSCHGPLPSTPASTTSGFLTLFGESHSGLVPVSV